ncbi:MAG TPA: hypothetical protein VHI93_01385 [Candidatus Thermoplasmatota archaeon]|nr:hypothetical protein [Candidatus Thermoplasmatota archaeon]
MTPRVWTGCNPATYYVKCDECGPIHEGVAAAYAKARAKAHRETHAKRNRDVAGLVDAIHEGPTDPASREDVERWVRKNQEANL